MNLIKRLINKLLNKKYNKKLRNEPVAEVVKNLYVVEYINASFIKNSKDIANTKGLTISVAAVNEEDAKRLLAKRVFLANDVDILMDQNGSITGCISRCTEEHCGIYIHEKYKFLRVKFICEAWY